MNVNDLDISSIYAHQTPSEDQLRYTQYRALPRPAKEILRIRLQERKKDIGIFGYRVSRHPFVADKHTMVRAGEYFRRIEQMLVAECGKRGVQISIDQAVSFVVLVANNVHVTEFVVEDFIYMRLDSKTRSKLKAFIKRVVDRRVSYAPKEHSQ